MDWLARLFGNIGNSVGGAASNIGRGVGSVMQGMGNTISPILSQAAPMVGNLFKGASQQNQAGYASNAGNVGKSMGSGFNIGSGTAAGSAKASGFDGFLPLIQSLMGGGQSNQKTAQAGNQTNAMQPKNINIGSGLGSGLGQNMISNWSNNINQSQAMNQPTQQQVQTPAKTDGIKLGGIDFLNGLLGKNPAQALMGMGVGFGGQMVGTPKQPDLSQLSSVKSFKNFDITKNTQTIRPELLKAFQDQTSLRDQQEQKALYARYANLQPGNSPEESSTFKTDLTNLQRTQADRASAELAQLYAQNAATQMGLNEQESQQMQEVAQLDVDQIMNQFGIDYTNAMKLKEMFGNMGGTMVSSAFGAFKPVTEGA